MADPGYSIERVTHDPTQLIGALAQLAADEGHQLGLRTIDDWDTGANRIDRPGEGLFTARIGDVIVAMCGMNIDPYLDDPTVGRLRHLYVHPDHRRDGVASMIVRRCLDLAAESFLRVRLRTANPAADALYRSLGFSPVTDPTASHELRITAGLHPDQGGRAGSPPTKP